MDAALVVTNNTTSATWSYFLLTSSLMRENPDAAESKSPVGEDEATTTHPIRYSTLYNMKRKF